MLRVPFGLRRAEALVLIAAALHGLVYLLLLAPWMGEDEPWHVEYVHHVAAGHLPLESDELLEAVAAQEMPLAHLQLLRRIGGVPRAEIDACEREILASMLASGMWERVDWIPRERGAESFDSVVWSFTAATQPPVYYLLAGAWAAVFGGGDPTAEMWAGRALSYLLYLAVVALALALGRLCLEDGSGALLAAAFVAWWPMHARQAAVVNNDVLAKALLAGVLLLAARQAVGKGAAAGRWAMVGLCLVCLMTKTTAAAAVPIALFGVLLGGRGRFAFRRLALVRGLRFGLPLLAVVALGLGYWATHNNPAVPRSLTELKLRIGRGLDPEQLAILWRTAVGTFNWESRLLPPWAYQACAIGLLAAVPGLVVGLWRGRGLAPGGRRVLVLLLLAVATQLVLVVLRGEARGRYVLVQIAAFGALWAAGALLALPERWRARAAPILVLLLVAFDATFAVCGLVWNQYVLLGA